MLFKPDDFKFDPYGFVTNQISHVYLIGTTFGALIVCLGYFWFYGEFPSRWSVFVWFSASYLAYELVDQGWNGWDTLQDWACVSIGVAGPLYTFHEHEIGTAVVIGDLTDLVPFVLALFIFLVIGAIRRWWWALGRNE